ncbi:MAG: SH3 domain-containing protein [Leptospiraceae bacterium]|nr:SH3 domain-containing protein [Leptospiraceae bacterium]MCP5499983.1 SH3 domain-containing protein [Leptospiraceae bacterium]
MKHLTLIILIFGLLSSTCKKEKKLEEIIEDSPKTEEKNPAKTEDSKDKKGPGENSSDDIRSVNASSLYVRQEANTSSAKVLLLPYGTSLKVEKTKESGTYGGKTDFWYFSKDAGGYLFGAYLSSESLEDKKIAMDLYSENTIMEDCSSKTASSGQIKKLELYYNKAIYRRNFTEKPKLSLRGSYTVKESGFYLEFPENADENFQLSYLKEYNGFIRQEYLKLLKEKEFILDKKACVFIRNECKNSKTGKNYRIAYFCPHVK